MKASSIFPVRDYDLGATLASGQAFRWQPEGQTSLHRTTGTTASSPRPSPPEEERECHAHARFGVTESPMQWGQAWTGVVGTHWVRLRPEQSSITAETAEPVSDWGWLTHYLQLDVNLAEVLRTFPDDEPMRAAVAACRGLRLLRQEPWECLASFILSSTKQIVQIRQIVARLCERYGEPVAVPSGQAPAYAFPSPARLAGATEAELRACKMGFRAPYLLATARAIDGGRFDLARLHQMPAAAARAELMELPGVGRKIADCVLLFAYGFQLAFPVDVWILKGLRRLYFPRRKVSLRQLHCFAVKHFGPNAGYAQQYLFHYLRTGDGRQESGVRSQESGDRRQETESSIQHPASSIHPPSQSICPNALPSRKCSRTELMTNLEVLFAPTEFAALKGRDLSGTVCVVFDILRATSTMLTALNNGAAAIIPVEEIPEALAIRRQEPDVLLAGERDGVRIQANLTGSIAFDLGNSPREFTREKVCGRTIVMTTTNGTRALRACLGAKTVLAGSFLNLRATAHFITREKPADLLLVCSGTQEQAAYEDVLGAGALCDRLWPLYGGGAVADSARIAWRLFRLEQDDLFAAVGQSRNGARLLAQPELRGDVRFCVTRNTLELLAHLDRDGKVKKLG